MFRGYQQQRLSDKLLGWVMFILAMELQDYTFGFSGISILWTQLNGFPRGVSLLFGPLVFFYFQAQVNRSFSISRQDLWHFLPHTIYMVYELSAFIQGAEAVNARQEANNQSIAFFIFSRGLLIGSFIYYFSRCLNILQKYRLWSMNQFSNTELISFKWFQNFIYAMVFWLIFREAMNVLDLILDLPFYQDWWWNLALVAVAFYIGLAGYEQKQPTKINFQWPEHIHAIASPVTEEIAPEERAPHSPLMHSLASNEAGTMQAAQEKVELASKLDRLMREDRLFLQPDLSLQELAQHLQLNTAQVSAIINQVVGQNFNDYINHLRVEEFIRLYQEDKDRKFTILSLALDSGFNSKSTFNRAFKKFKGMSPKAFFVETVA